MSSHFKSNDSNLSATGRFGRLSYLGWNMLLGFCFLFLGIIAAILIPAFNTSSTNTNFIIYILGGILVIIYLVALYYSFIFTIRRLHDRNHSGWLSLLMLVPLINLFFFIYLSCAKGDEHSNHYGAPRTTRGWEKVLAWIYIILVPIAILVFSASAIDSYQDYLQRSQQMQMEQYGYSE